MLVGPVIELLDREFNLNRDPDNAIIILNTQQLHHQCQIQHVRDISSLAKRFKSTIILTDESRYEISNGTEHLECCEPSLPMGQEAEIKQTDAILAGLAVRAYQTQHSNWPHSS